MRSRKSYEGQILSLKMNLHLLRTAQDSSNYHLLMQNIKNDRDALLREFENMPLSSLIRTMKAVKPYVPAEIHPNSFISKLRAELKKRLLS